MQQPLNQTKSQKWRLNQNIQLLLTSKMSGSALISSIMKLQPEINLLELTQYIRRVHDTSIINYQAFLLMMVLAYPNEVNQSHAWKLFYEVLNEVLKLNNQTVQYLTYQFALFLISGDLSILDQYEQAKSHLKVIVWIQFQKIGIRSLQRVFNSVLCLQSLKLRQVVKFLDICFQNHHKITIQSQYKLKCKLQRYASTQFTYQDIIHLIHIIIGQSNLNQFAKYIHQIDEGSLPLQLMVMEQVSLLELYKVVVEVLLQNRQIETRDALLIGLIQYLPVKKDILFSITAEYILKERNDTVADILIKLISNQCLKLITIRKVKTLLRNIKIVLKQVEQIDYNGISQILRIEEIPIEKQLKRVKQIIDLLSKMSSKYNHSSLQLYFQGKQSYLRLKQLNGLKSLLMIVDIHPHQDQVLQIFSIKGTKNINFILKLSLQVRQKSLLIQIISNEKEIVCEKKSCIGGYEFFVTVNFDIGNSIGFSVDGAYYVIEDSDKYQILEMEIGRFEGTIKDLFFLKKCINVQTIHKHWMDLKRKTGLLIESIGLNLVLSQVRGGQHVLTTQSKSVWPWSNKSVEYQFNNVERVRGISFVEAISEIGGLQSLIFLIERMSCNTNNSPESIFVIESFFIFLKTLTVNDTHIVLAWIEQSINYFSQFLWLLIRRNKIVTQSPTLFIKILDFLLYFKNDLRDKPQIFSQVTKTRLTMIQQEVVSKILLNFQLWAYCNESVLQAMLTQFVRIIESRNSNKRYIHKDYVEQILSGGVFFLSSNQHEEDEMSNVRGRIVQICLKVCEQYQHPSLRNEIKTIAIGDLQFATSLLFSFFTTHLSYTVSEIATIQMLCDFIQENFINLNRNWSIIYQSHQSHWVSIFNVLVDIIQKSPPEIKIIKRIVSLSISIITKQPILYNHFSTLIKTIFKREDTFSTVLTLSITLLSNLKPLQIGFQLEIVQFLLNYLQSRINTNTQPINITQIHSTLLSFPIQSLIITINCTLFPIIIQQIQSSQNINIQHSLLSELFTKFYSSDSGLNALPFLNTVIVKYPQYCFFKVPNSKVNLMLIQYFHSEQLLKFLIKYNLINSEATYLLSGLQLNGDNDQLGGTLGCYLSLEDLQIEQLQILYNIQLVSVNEYLECYQQRFMNFSDSVDLVLLLSSYKIMSMLMNYLLKNEKSLNKRQIAIEMVLQLSKRVEIKVLNSFKENEKQVKSSIKMLQKILQKNTQRVKMYEIIKLIGYKMISSYQKYSNNISAIYLEFIQVLKQQNHITLENYLLKQSKKITQILQVINSTCTLFLKLSTLPTYTPKYQPTHKLLTLPTYTPKYQPTHKLSTVPDPILTDDLKSGLGVHLYKLFKKLDSLSRASYQSWSKVCKRNNFWLHENGKIPNQLYEMDLKQFGFYHLNIRELKNKSFPYPRRKQNFVKDSFEMEKQILVTQKMFNKTVSSLLTFPQIEPIHLSDKQILNQKSIFYCEYVLQKGIYGGYLLFKDSYLIFKSIGHNRLPKGKVYQLSTAKYHRLTDQIKVIIPITENGQLFTRRYIFRHTAIQIFYDRRSYFFNLFQEVNQKKLIKLLRQNNSIECIIDRVADFKKKKITEKWKNHIISNFQYLMLVNRYSGRTYHDLAQYYVFPWVINDYSAQHKEPTKNFIKSHLRNLEDPIGKLNPQKFNKLKARFNEIEAEDYEIRFLYGTMYSNPTVLYNYFIRLEPFTSLHWNHQGQKIDHADRLFFGVNQQFTSVMTASSDMRELTPQFYYWPQFLKNRNLIDLGKKQDKRQVNNVLLPGWAQNPQQFIFKMRQALESNEVGLRIGLWIDLIFGCKAPYEVAEKFDNLYNYQSYQHDIFNQQTEAQISSSQVCISEFGQIPQSIFSDLHPQRHPKRQIEIDSSILLNQFANPTNFQLCEGAIFCFSQTEISIMQIQIKGCNFKINELKHYTSMGTYSKLYSIFDSSWLSINSGVLRIYQKKKILFEKQIQAKAIDVYQQFIIHGFRSKLIVSTFDEGKFSKVCSLYGHQNEIYFIKVSSFLDVIISVDLDGIALVHQLSSHKYVRQFKLQLRASQKIKCLQMHEMGYFIFLSTFQKILVISLMGETYLSHDLQILRVGGQVQQISSVKILKQYSSQVALSTTKGNIFIVDFLQIKRFNGVYPYKTYSRIKHNIIEKAKKQLTPGLINGKIINFYIDRTSGEQIPTIKIIVLYETGHIVAFYPKKVVQTNLKSKKTLKELGVF